MCLIMHERVDASVRHVRVSADIGPRAEARSGVTPFLSPLLQIVKGRIAARLPDVRIRVEIIGSVEERRRADRFQPGLGARRVPETTKPAAFLGRTSSRRALGGMGEKKVCLLEPLDCLGQRSLEMAHCGFKHRNCGLKVGAQGVKLAQGPDVPGIVD